LPNKGHYLEDLNKIYGKLPAPNAYDVVVKWKDSKNGGVTSGKPRSAPPKRMTFID